MILTEALGAGGGRVPLRGQAAERRQDDPGDRDVGDDLARTGTSRSSAAVGASRRFAANFWADNLVIETSGPAYRAFKKAMLAEKGKVRQHGQLHRPT